MPPEVRTALTAAARSCDMPLDDLSLQLLYNRGVQTEAMAIAFLRGGSAALHDPYQFLQMDVAVDRVLAAMSADERIAIYGDYDADGVTATAVLVKALRAMGADVIPYIPHRSLEGYGMNLGALRKLQEDGVKLVITVDCGISNMDEVGAAMNDLDMDVIVTDHHRAPRNLPQSLALISARHPDNTYPYLNLTGVGVAYQLVRALIQRGATMREVKNRDLLELVAIGTVADVAPLDGENRVLVANGLWSMRNTRNEGLRSLMQIARLDPNNLDTGSIGFGLAPRINAAGRLESAWDAYHLLMADDPFEASRLASNLEANNRERQKLTADIHEQATINAIAMDDDTPIIIVHGVGWNAGIVGLAASRLKEQFNRPVIVIEEMAEMSKGSARSIDGFNITDALTEVADLLSRFGGHAMAAGFSIPTANLPEFKRRLLVIGARQIAAGQLLPEIKIDAELHLRQINPQLEQQLNYLAPWGTGNPAPVFASRRLRVMKVYAMGAGKQHLKLTLYDRDRHVDIKAVYWKQGELFDQLQKMPFVDVAYQMRRNEWNGQSTIELELKDLRIVE